ncbi:pilus assembly PilX family protein [Candidatus Sororendozoicomonas aggregata]|uniref:pilus assembly PilX family protein n=1 Tax=Candidatus Sororendozoicomonas aggregata TaxID=3073239 RepID=UPI002ED21925
MKQQGSVLLVSLMILLILTVAGLTVINSSSIEGKVTGQFIDHQVAFNAGEAALLAVEEWIEATALDLTAFTSRCTNGLCFNGSDPDAISTCDTHPSFPWKDTALWDDNTRVGTLPITLDGVVFNTRYLVEFRCYLPRESEGPDPDPASSNDWAQFFRISVLASGNVDTTRVMLQSTYKKNP